MLCWKRNTSKFLNFFLLPKKNEIRMAELNRSYPYLFLWVVPTLDFPCWRASDTLLYFSLATYSVKIQFSTVSLLQSSAHFEQSSEILGFPAFTSGTARTNCCLQPETLKRIEDATFYSRANEKVQTYNHLLFRPSL